MKIEYLHGIVTGELFLEKIHDAETLAETAKALVSYFEALQVGFVKRLFDANLVFCSCVLYARMKTCEKIEVDLLIFIDG